MSDDRSDDCAVPHEHSASDRTPVFPAPRNPFEALQNEFRALEFRVVRDSGAALSEVAALGAQVESELVDLRGKSGNNGKIGTLRSDIATIKASLATLTESLEKRDEKRASRMTSVIVAVATALGGSAYAVYASVGEKGRDANRLDRVEQDVRELADDLKFYRAPWRDRSTQPVRPALSGDDQ